MTALQAGHGHSLPLGTSPGARPAALPALRTLFLFYTKNMPCSTLTRHRVNVESHMGAAAVHPLSMPVPPLSFWHLRHLPLTQSPALLGSHMQAEVEVVLHSRVPEQMRCKAGGW